MFHAVVAIVVCLPPAVSTVRDPSYALFHPAGPVYRVRITVDEANLKALRQNERAPVHCTVRVDGETFKDVSLHLKGAAGSFRGWDDKPGLTLNPHHFVGGQTVRGLGKFHLNNGAQDGSYLQELLANELALAAGIPACRCTHAMVELNGRKVGPYVLKEGFDRAWLKRHFDDPSGTLYDGGFLTDIDGQLKLSSGTDNGRKDLQAVAQACRGKDRAKRYEAVSKLVDVDEFATFAALQIVTADWDGYVRKPNNYRVYFEPEGKAVFIPHGMDQMWQNPHEGIWQGWGGMVARVILDHPEGKKKVIAELKRMCRDFFTVEKLHRRIDELAPRLHEALAKQDRGQAANFDREIKDLKERIKQRAEYLAKELPKLK